MGGGGGLKGVRVGKGVPSHLFDGLDGAAALAEPAWRLDAWDEGVESGWRKDQRRKQGTYGRKNACSSSSAWGGGG